MSRSGKALAVSAAVGVTALGAAIGVTSLANADPTPTSSPSATPSAPGTPSTGAPDTDRQRGDRGRASGIRFEELAQQLAGRLGLTRDQVQTALEEIWEEHRPTARPDPSQQRDPAERNAEFAKALAEKLGVDEARVKTALDEIRAERQAEQAAALKERLDAAVQAGTLTQAEADAVVKAVEKGIIYGR